MTFAFSPIGLHPKESNWNPEEKLSSSSEKTASRCLQEIINATTSSISSSLAYKKPLNDFWKASKKVTKIDRNDLPGSHAETIAKAMHPSFMQDSLSQIFPQDIPNQLHKMKTELNQLIQGEEQSSSWLGKLYDKGHEIALNIIPGLGSYEKELLKSFAVPITDWEEEKLDLACMDRCETPFMQALETVHKWLKALPYSSKIFQECMTLKERLESSLEFFSRLRDYIERFEELQQMKENLASNERLLELAPKHYEGIVECSKNLKKFHEKNYFASIKWGGKLERKFRFHIEETRRCLEDFTEDLHATLEQEIKGLKQQGRAAAFQIFEDSGNLIDHITALHDTYFGFKKLQYDCKRFVTFLSKLHEDSKVPHEFQKDISSQILSFQKLYQKISDKNFFSSTACLQELIKRVECKKDLREFFDEELKNAKNLSAEHRQSVLLFFVQHARRFSSSDSELLKILEDLSKESEIPARLIEGLRKDLPALTKARQCKPESSDLAEDNIEASPSKWSLFFLYLQAWGLISPALFSLKEQSIIRAKQEEQAISLMEKWQGAVSLEKLKLFLNSSSLPVSEAALAQTFGEKEYNEHFSLWEYRLSLLKARISLLDHHPLCDSKMQKGFCKDFEANPAFAKMATKDPLLPTLKTLENKLQRSFILSEAFSKNDVNEFFQLIKTNLYQLGNDDSFFFYDAANSLAYEILYSANSYSVRIYNSNPSFQSHAHVVKSHKLLYLPFIEMINIPTRTFFNKRTWEGLQNIAHQKLSQTLCYEKIHSLFGGESSKKEYPIDELSERSFSGASNYQILSLLFSEHLQGRKSHQRVEYESQLKTLLDFVHQHPPKASNERIFPIIQRASTEFATRLLKWQKQGIIHPEELHWTTDKIHEIIDSLKLTSSGQENPPSTLQANPLTISFKTHSPYSFDSLGVSALNMTSAFSSYHSMSTLSWQPKGSSLFQDLSDFHHSIQKANGENCFFHTTLGVEDLIKKIPLLDEKFWHQIPVQQALGLIETLTALSKEYVKSLLNSGKDFRPENYITQIKILSIVDKILNTFPLLPSTLSLYQQNFETVFSSTAVLPIIVDPTWKASLKELKTYWHEKKEPSLFDNNEKEGLLNHVFSSALRPSFAINTVQNFLLPLSPEQEKQLRNELPPFLHNFLDDPFTTNYLRTIYALSDPYFELVIENKILNEKWTLSRSERTINLLPQVFFDLRDLSIVTQFFSFAKPSFSTKLEGLPNVKCISLLAAYPERTNLYYRPNKYAQQLIASLKCVGNDGTFYSDFEQNRKLMQSNNFFPIDLKHLDGIALQKKSANFFERLRIPPEKIWSYSQNVPLNERSHFRELIALSSTPALQIQQTLSYFSRNTHLLDQPKYQELLQFLLFEHELLSQEFDKSLVDVQKFSDDLSAFCHHAFSYFIEINDINSASFILWLNHQLHENVQHAEKHLNINFLDSRAELIKLLERNDLSIDTRSLLHRDLARTYATSTELSTHQAAQLLTAAIHYFIHPPPLDKENSRTLKEINEVLHRRREAIDNLLNGKDRDLLLNTVFQAFFPHSTPIQWKPSPSFPQFANQAGDIVINVLEGTLFVNSNKVDHFLPSSISLNSQFIALFGEERLIGTAKVSTIAEGRRIDIYTFTGPDQRPYRVLDQLHDRLVIQAEFYGKWYTLAQPSECFDRSLPQSLSIAHFFWRHSDHIILTDKSTHKSCYHIKKEGKIEQLTQGVPSGYIVGSYEKEKPLDFIKTLNGFEDEDQTLILLEKESKNISKISFPRYSLEFLAVNSELLIQNPPELKGYALAKKPHIPALGNMDDYLVLEKKEAQKQLIIFPYTPSRLSKDNSMGPQLFIFEFDPKTGRLLSKSEESAFYLALKYLSEKNYDSAFHILNESSSQIQAYTPLSIEILKHISQTESEKSDMHVRAAASRLKAHILLIKQNQNYGHTSTIPGIDVDLLKDHYCSYLQMQENAGTVSLTDDDEKFLIKHLQKSLNPFDIRHQLIFQRMQNLGLPVETSLLWSFPPQISEVPLSVNGKIHFSKLLSPFSFQTFSSKEFLKRYESERLTGKASNPLVDKFFAILSYFKNPATESELFSELLLAAVSLYPERFPPDLTMLEANISNEEKQQWFQGYLLEPLKQLTISEPKLHKYVFGVPSIIQNQKLESSQISGTSNDIPPIYSHSVNLSPLSLFSEPVFSYTLPLEKIFIQNTDVNSFNRTEFELEKFKRLSLNDDISQRELTGLIKQIEGPETIVEDAQEQNSPKQEQDSPKFGPKPLVSEIFNYAITDQHAFLDLKARVEQDILQLESGLTIKKEEIEALANKPFSNPIQRALTQLRHLAHLDTPIDLKEVIHFYLKRDAALVRQRNSALNNDDILFLQQSIQNYLVTATYQQHLQRIKESMDNALSITARNGPSTSLQEALNELVSASKQKREYTITVHPEYLVLEYYANKLFWKDQIESLDKLRIDQGCIHEPQHLGKAMEFAMGRGKTSIITPLLSLLHADGTRLVTIVMPKVLIESMSIELRSILKTAFKQSLEILYVDRQTRFDKEKLDQIEDLLKQIQKDKKVLLLSSESLQSLLLSFVEKLRNYHQEAIKKTSSADFIWDEIRSFQKIFRLLKASGTAIIDEIDTVLDISRSFHFTTGEEGGLDPISAKATIDFYRFIEMHNLPHPFSIQNYHKEIKSKLIEAILNRKFNPIDKAWQAFFVGLTADEKTLLESFLNGKTTQKTLQMTDNIPNEVFQDTLAVLKAQLNELFPLTASRNLFEHYGPTTNTSEEASAIPYHLGRPSSIGTQFGTELEILNYTIQMFLEIGISASFIQNEIERIQKNLKIEIQNNSKIKNLKDTEAYREFLDLTGENNEYSLFAFNAEAASEIARRINQNPDKLLELVSKIILPKIRLYETQLNSDSQIFGILFKEILGMTGTMWNADTYTKAISKLFSSDAIAKTIQTLWKKDSQRVIPVPALKESTENKVVTFLENIIGEQFSKKCSLIDAANLLRGISNRFVAECLWKIAEKNQWQVKGVAFYDNDTLMVLTHEKDQWETVKFSDANISKNDLIAYWDQSHTTGSNIKLDPSMHAAVTIGKHTDLRDLAQAVRRLRELDNDQDVHFVSTTEDLKLMRHTLETATSQKYTENFIISDLILYTLLHQAERQGRDNYRALKQKMQAFLLQKVMHIIINTEEPQHAADMFHLGRSLFESHQKIRPYYLYAKSSDPIDKTQAVKNYTDRFLNQHRSLIEALGGASIENDLLKLAEDETKHLPSHVIDDDFNKEKTIHVSTQQMNEIKTQKATQVNVEQRQDTDQIENKQILIMDDAPQPTQEILFWPRKYLFTNSYFTDSSRLVQPLQARLQPWAGDIAPTFDKDILCSTNLWPEKSKAGVWQILSTTPMPSEYKAYPYQKDFHQVLLVQEKASETIKLVLIDQNDALQFKEWLIDDSCNSNRETRETLLALYDLSSGIYVQGKEKFDPRKLEMNAQFQRLKIQAKFLKGLLNYSEAELAIFKTWLSGSCSDPQKLEEFFRDNIMKSQLISPKEYLQDNLAKVFKTLKVKPQIKANESFFGKYFRRWW